MRPCVTILLLLALVVVLAVGEVEKKARNTGSLPDSLVENVQDAKAFLRQRSSQNGALTDQNRRDLELEEVEEALEHRHRYRGHRRYPYRVGYSHRGRIPIRSRIRYRVRNHFRNRFGGYRY